MLDDALSVAIADKRAERDALARQLERLDVEIATLEFAASLRPINERPNRRQSPNGAESRGKGRQVGAISETWRNILRMMHDLHPDGAPDPDVLEICVAEGLTKIRSRDVTRRMLALQLHGYVSQSSGGWHVTETAIKRFALDTSRDQMKAAGDSQSPAAHDTDRMS
ncbi:MAG: hypothetical protein HWD60_19160 [Defluviicoccus sp.]|nr:MAG: hypothetical protein HWD60_19160 [Defluviicoccus sp.]